MKTPRNLDGLIRTYLREDPIPGQSEVPDHVYRAIRDGIEQTRQRAVIGSVGVPVMNKFVAIGLGAAAVVVLLFISANLRGSLGLLPGGEPSASAAPSDGAPSAPASSEPSEATTSVEPASSGDGSLPVGLHVLVSTVGLNEDRVTVTIPAPGWFAEPDEGSVTKDLGGGDRVTVMTVPGDHYQVPTNICSWQASRDLDGIRIAETVDELVAYLAEQTYDTPEGSLTRELSAPVNITIDGWPGQSITGVVPVYPDSDPDGCDQQRFCSLLDRDGNQCLLSHLEPNALVTLWISDPGDRNPPLWVVAASYWPTTGSELRAEMNAIVDSMTFPLD